MIVAIDPGKVSGVVLWDSDYPIAVESFELPPLEVTELVEYLWASQSRPKDMVVVTEKFTISQRTVKTALSLDALDINGWLTLESQRRGFELVVQTPAQAKSFATDAKLKALDWYYKTKDGHANDAARHLLVYLMNHRPAAREVLVPMLAKEIL